MKKQILLTFIVAALGCTKKPHDRSVYNELIPMPEFYRKVTGYDSIQLYCKGSGMKWDNDLKNFVVVYDKLTANFCYPNEWEFEKFKKDTVYIHDTIYLKNRYKNDVFQPSTDSVEEIIYIPL